jgi:hypothetical protein
MIVTRPERAAARNRQSTASARPNRSAFQRGDSSRDRPSLERMCPRAAPIRRNQVAKNCPRALDSRRIARQNMLTKALKIRLKEREPSSAIPKLMNLCE